MIKYSQSWSDLAYLDAGEAAEQRGSALKDRDAVRGECLEQKRRECAQVRVHGNQRRA